MFCDCFVVDEKRLPVTFDCSVDGIVCCLICCPSTLGYRPTDGVANRIGRRLLVPTELPVRPWPIFPVFTKRQSDLAIRIR
jgi:hypothetical protein